MKITFAALLALCACGATWGQASITVYGDVRCGAYLEVRRAGHDADGTAMYVQGFVTAHNMYGSAKQVEVEGLPASTIHAYLEKFCRENPLMGVTNAAARLVIDLGGGMVPQHQRKRP